MVGTAVERTKYHKGQKDLGKFEKAIAVSGLPV